MSATTQIKVLASNFVAASIVSSTEETRYYLCGVYIQPHPVKGAILVATDGQRLVAVHDEEATCNKPAIISLDKAALKLLQRFDGSLEIDSDGIATFGTYRGVASSFIDGTFPDWQRALSPIIGGAKNRFHGKPVFSIAAFNGRYLGSFERVANALSKGDMMVRVVSFSASDPTLILFPNTPHAYGVLMPMRAPNEEFAMPAWMKPVLEPKAADGKKAKQPTRKAA